MDYLAKSVTENGDFRAYVVDATKLAQQLSNIHHTNYIASLILSRAAIATLLTASSVLKGEEQMQSVLNGRGTIGNIVVESDTKGNVRGYVTNPKAQAVEFENKPNVGATVGTNGFLKITKLAPYSKPFTGQVPLITGEIGDDFTYYLAQSEQIPSSLGVSVLVNKDGSVAFAGGFLIQVLPGTTTKSIEEIENKIKTLPPIYTQLAEGFTPKGILQKIFENITTVNIVDNIAVNMAEELPKSYYAKAIESLPEEEIKQMINEDKGAEIITRFTNSKYYFNDQELKQILLDKQSNN
ncbi:MAG: Hsp33 family molecular chaperone HslO [Lactobacillaceae bacterium]|nr:Hsp33 family molecular chaperone HslO [Lactobacillaceae bacterium]